jgi:hypothetical protein
VPSTGVAATAKFSRTPVRLRCAGNCRYGTSEFAASLDVVSNPSPICPDYRDRSRQPAVNRRLAFRPLACAGILPFNIAISNNIAVSKRAILNGCEQSQRLPIKILLPII